jgi:twitching motility two-component system response regulator PilH
MAMQALLVEDSPTQAQFYKDILEQLGLEVNIAVNGKDALDFAYRYHPQLIVLDVNLPIMDGFQVCSRLSRSGETNSIPIIMLTERGAAEDAQAGLQSGAIKYIAKDQFAAETLSASIRQLGVGG